jgi:hypothetical protein
MMYSTILRVSIRQVNNGKRRTVRIIIEMMSSKASTTSEPLSFVHIRTINNVTSI